LRSKGERPFDNAGAAGWFSGSIKSPLTLFSFVEQGVDKLQLNTAETSRREQTVVDTAMPAARPWRHSLVIRHSMQVIHCEKLSQ